MISCFVAIIDLKLAEKLQTDLHAQGFLFSKPDHTIFSAKKKGVSCTLYPSGKLTVQGKEKEEFISFYLEPEILQSLEYTYPETGVDMSDRIGIDEAGKGDFFGPLCIAGVQAGPDTIKKFLQIGVKDSKRLSDSTIFKLATQIKEIAPFYVVPISPAKYNQLYDSFKNLNKLLAWGHATAIEQLVKRTGCQKVIIDQFGAESLVTSAVKKKGLTIDLHQKHHGEADPVVAAASILARASFLDGLEKLGQSISAVLPKGASTQVVKTGKTLVAKQGKEILSQVAKLHFKTLDDILVDH